MAAVKRGCGFRVTGGVYVETKLSRFGTPVTAFLLDPPVPVNVEAMGLSPRGVKLAQDQAGVWHIWDWVGAQHYPNVADFVEEVKRLGVSRRISAGEDVQLLTAESRLLLVHPAAIIVPWEQTALLAQLDAPNGVVCPTGKHRHLSSAADQCIGLCWHDLVQGKPVRSKVERDAWEVVNGRSDREVERVMPAFAYGGWSRIDPAPQHRPGLFAAFPIGQITVIRDPVAGEHEGVVGQVIEKGPVLPVRVEEA